MSDDATSMSRLSNTLMAWQSHERLVSRTSLFFGLVRPLMSNSVTRCFQVFSFILPILYLIFLRPRQHRIEIPTHLHHIEIRIRHKLSMTLLWNPVIRHNVKVGMAHERLQQNMDTVCSMVQPPPRRLFLAPIVLPIQVFAQPVEAVYLVEGIELEDICIIPSAPRNGRFDSVFWSFLAFGEGEGGRGEDGAGEEVPGCVDFWTGLLTEDRGIVFEGAVESVRLEGEVDFVEYGRCERLVSLVFSRRQTTC